MYVPCPTLLWLQIPASFINITCNPAQSPDCITLSSSVSTQHVLSSSTSSPGELGLVFALPVPTPGPLPRDASARWCTVVVVVKSPLTGASSAPVASQIRVHFQGPAPVLAQDTKTGACCVTGPRRRAQLINTVITF